VTGIRRKIKVLIVDDSVVYRSQLRNAITTLDYCEVVAVASNGKMAVERLSQNAIDLMILDLEMPEMNGLETLQEMSKRGYSVKVLLFSSHSKRGAEITMDALRAGASDFVPKPGAEFHGADMGSDPAKKILDLIKPKIEALFGDLQGSNTQAPKRPDSLEPAGAVYPKLIWETVRPKVVVIGSSTGGPTALEKLFSEVAGPIAVPILIAQHMPPIFTATLAERLKKLLGIEVHEGRHGELIQPNHIYVAPGDFHMTVVKTPAGVAISLNQAPHENFVRPAVDPLFRSAAEIFGPGCLAAILTGMGSDGKNGCIAVKDRGGAVMIQDKESCVVFGMPGAVHASGAFDYIGDTSALASILRDKVAPNQLPKKVTTGLTGLVAKGG
jgi:two-component system chemotaxis response regulator CheB